MDMIKMWFSDMFCGYDMWISIFLPSQHFLCLKPLVISVVMKSHLLKCLIYYFDADIESSSFTPNKCKKKKKRGYGKQNKFSYKGI